MKLSQLKTLKIYHVLRALRPRQWLKNLSVYAAPLFWGNLFEVDVFKMTTKAALIFTMLSAGTYLINDVLDAPKDRLHPVKKNRPVAGGFISDRLAMILAFCLVVGAIILARAKVGRFFALTVIVYFAIQILYSLVIRNVIILDALVVASGFVVRVFAGAFATSIPISSWLILSVIGLSLLLAFGKRRSERTLLSAKHVALETRDTLKHYPDNLLDSMISMSATFAVVTYSLFAFQTQTTTTDDLAGILPSTLNTPKWMMLTIPVVIYGVARYLYVVYEKKEGESPERVLLSDVPLLNTLIIWISAIIIIVYGFQTS